jgi:hypothetical protein
MPTRVYRFEFHGTAAGHSTWKTSGKVVDENNNLMDVFDHAMRETFLQLTQGKAVFGQPGVGCSGPYEITSLTLTKT